MLLLADVFFGDKRRGLAPTLTLLILVIGALLTAKYANVTERVLLFSESYVADPLAVMLKLFAYSKAKAAVSSARSVLFGQCCVRSCLIKIDYCASGQTAEKPRHNGLL